MKDVIPRRLPAGRQEAEESSQCSYGKTAVNIPPHLTFLIILRTSPFSGVKLPITYDSFGKWDMEYRG